MYRKKTMDVTQTCRCPYCNEIIGYLWLRKENVLGTSGPHERYNFTFGFERYYTYTFACPKCGLEFYVDHQKL